MLFSASAVFIVQKLAVYDLYNIWLACHLFNRLLSGLGLQGEAGKTEDRRHRAFYHTLSDSEAKLQFFAARQIACRILGSHGYLCEDVSSRKLHEGLERISFSSIPIFWTLLILP